MHGATQRRSAIDAITADIARAELRVANRRAAVPKISYPPELPVSQRRDEILAAIRGHQVVIVAGRDRSGKTTQLPKICLELGRGVRGHDRPHPAPPARRAHGGRADRRGARTCRSATSSATPSASPTGSSDRTLVQGHDRRHPAGRDPARPRAARATTRSSSTRRTSAASTSTSSSATSSSCCPAAPTSRSSSRRPPSTPQRFSRHFDDARSSRCRGAPTRWRCATGRSSDEAAPTSRGRDGDDRGRATRSQAILDAVEELCARGRATSWCSSAGEREIRDTADALRRSAAAPAPRSCRSTPGCPPPSSTASSSRTPAGASCSPPTWPRRRYRPGIRTSSTPARRASPATASGPRCSGCRSSRSRRRRANQRAGRCGRVSAGICIRLYAEEDFAARPAFTEPEILRTNLASVILQMTALGLGDIAAFPFVEPPDRRNVEDGVAAARGARARSTRASATTAGALTASAAGWRSCRSTPGWPGWCSRPSATAALREVMVIAAGAVHPGPPGAARRKAAGRRRAHGRFADPDSDFLAYLNLWRLPARAAAEPVVQPVPPAVPARVPQLPAGARVAGHPQPAAPGVTGSSASTRSRGPADAGQHPHRAAGRPAVPHRAAATGDEARVPRRPRRAVRDLPGLGAVQEDRRAG